MVWTLEGKVFQIILKMERRAGTGLKFECLKMGEGEREGEKGASIFEKSNCDLILKFEYR